jgi:hypothetical protein
MPIAGAARILSPIVSFSSSLVQIVLFSIGIYFFHALQIDSVANMTYAGIIIFLIAWVCVVILCVYCTVIYDRLHRTLLLMVMISNSVLLGIFSYSMLNLSEQLLACVHALWKEYHLNSIERLQTKFACVGFRATENDDMPTCADTIRSYLNTYTQMLGTIFGISAIVFAFLSLTCICITCKRKESFQGEDAPDRVQFHDSIDPQKNNQLSDALISTGVGDV